MRGFLNGFAALCNWQLLSLLPHKQGRLVGESLPAGVARGTTAALRGFGVEPRRSGGRGEFNHGEKRTEEL